MAVEKINDALTARGIVVGSTRVVSVRTRRGEDPSGDETIIIKLVLAPPPAGLDTWPNDDLWIIREMVGDAVNELSAEYGFEVPWLISFVAEDQGELDPDDTVHEVNVDL